MKTKRCKLVMVKRVIELENDPTVLITPTEDLVKVRFSYGGRSYQVNYGNEIYNTSPGADQRSKKYDIYLIDPNPEEYRVGDRVVFKESDYYLGWYIGGPAKVEDETGAELFRSPVGKLLGGTTSEGFSLSPSCVERFFNTTKLELDVLVNFFKSNDRPIINKRGWIPIKTIPVSVPTEYIPINAIRDVLCNPYVSMDSNLKAQVSEIRSFLNQFSYLIK